MPSALPGAALAASALGLFAATFAPWFAHEELDGPEADRLRADESLILTLSGWELDGRIAALVLLAVFLGIGAGIWSIRRPRDASPPVGCWVAALGGLAATWAIGSELRAPSDDIYNDPRAWGKVALAAAAATAVVALLAGVAALARRRGEERRPVDWPLIGGAALLYLLALGANESEVWQPQLVGACCAAGVLGYLVPRWWLAALPLAVVVLVLSLTPDSGGESLRGVVYLFLAVVVSTALLIGVGTRALPRLMTPQQQV